MECTKRGLSVVAYTMLQSVGTQFFRAHVERLVQVAHELADAIHAAEDFELATYPDANIVCFRHLPTEQQLSPKELDAHQVRVRQALIESGRAYITQARLNDSTWLRTAVQNPMTSRETVEQLLADLRGLGRGLSGRLSSPGSR